MNYAVKNVFTMLAAALALAMAFAASAEGSDVKDTVNAAEEYNGNPSLIAALCQDYVDDAGERAVADFGLGILEGSEGLFVFASDDYSEEPPPNPMFPEPMEKGALYFGGTDLGRFIPESLVLSDGVRPDISVITQNGLADRAYLSSVREQLSGKVEMPTDKEDEAAFGAFVEGVQSGKIDVRDAVEIKDGRVTVTGVLAVMKINEILAKMIFEKNKGRHAMYVEESYPLEWMRYYLTPHGLVMKLNAEKRGDFSDEEVRENDEFWDWMTKRLLSSKEFAKSRAESWRKGADGNQDPEHRMVVRGFAGLRFAHARLYGSAKNRAAFETAIRQAVALDPLSPEIGYGYSLFLKARKLDAARNDYREYVTKFGGCSECL